MVFPPNSNRAEITIDIVDDDIVETTESFLLGLSAIGSKVILGSPNSATVSINDDDSKSNFYVNNFIYVSHICNQLNFNP